MTEEAIFLAALDKRDPAARAAYLDSACAGDPALRERVEALLRSHADPDSFLDLPALARQAGRDEPTRADSAKLPAAEQCRDPLRAGAALREAAPDAGNGALAFLAPGREPGGLGRLDHYEVLEVVGRGGMGMVFKARDTKLQRIVAIKVLAPPLAANSTARQRFVREARAGAAVRDDHVVSIHAVSDDRAVPYLVMEFIDGTTLADRIKARGPLEVNEILRIGMQAAAGLAAAHRQGLIHRDVKPSNILLENGVQRVKLTDFGLARAAAEDGLTQSGVIAGTPLYMSPEQARGEALDQRSDLFSLGSVLYTLCTGSPAFKAGNTMAVMKRVCDDVPRPVREVNPDIPDWLAAIVSRLHAKDPAERFQSAAELAELLGQHLAHLQQSGLAPPRPLEVPAGRKRSRLAVAGLLIAVGLVVVAILVRGWLFPRRGEPTTAVPPPDDPRVLTVSQKPEGGGRFRTIKEALEEVEPGMTIRILDDAVYEEHLLIHRPQQHHDVVLEAVGKATLRHPTNKVPPVPGQDHTIYIRGVPGFTVRRLRFESGAGRYSQVAISGSCPGVVLDQLTMAGDKGNMCIKVVGVRLSAQDAPITIRNCTMQNATAGVEIVGYYDLNFDHPAPCGVLVIRQNTLVGCDQPIILSGAVYRVHVVGNRILEDVYAAIDLIDLLPGTADVLIANNTLLRNRVALRLSDDSTKGKDFLKCKNMRFQNNLAPNGFSGSGG